MLEPTTADTATVKYPDLDVAQAIKIYQQSSLLETGSNKSVRQEPYNFETMLAEQLDDVIVTPISSKSINSFATEEFQNNDEAECISAKRINATFFLPVTPNASPEPPVSASPAPQRSLSRSLSEQFSALTNSLSFKGFNPTVSRS